MARASLGSLPPLTTSFHNLRLLSCPYISSPPKRLIFALHVSNTADTMPDRHHPDSSLEIIGGARDSLLSVFKTLQRPYDPFPLIGWNCHIETIFAAFFRSLPDVRFRRECLRTEDGGAVSLDWVSGDDRKFPAEIPVLILLVGDLHCSNWTLISLLRILLTLQPGLTGGSGDTYVRHMLVRARSNGWRVVVFNSRGCGDSPVTTAQFYSASFIEDLRQVVKHVATRYPKAKLYAVGWSLGANILVRYLGQESYSCPLSGAVSLCNPFNLVIADEDFHKGFNVIYDKALANALCKIFKRHSLLFEDMGGEYNIPLAANAKSVREFDDGLTRVSFGFKSVDDYYSNSSSSDSIKHVHIPLLCIQWEAAYCHPKGGKCPYGIQFFSSEVEKEDRVDSRNSETLALFLAGRITTQALESSLAASDPIAPSRGIPREDIKENPNCLLIVTPNGGHLGWVGGVEAPLGAPWTDPVVMEFLEHLERGRSKPFEYSSKSDSVQQSAESLHKLEV
ncbi:hypothetical protein HHK36_027414 [Tetracentron sinense]|uniref:AB hydrolase-1 domain-containing protein n=1 Tax=Tetracentron sinense TaxID=13715 RepID=A0A835D4E4_TETSI|nr:hypothetical protein HHK36_027414 [Tetracentron sinense]